jgi:hypothetical protein
MQTVDVHFFSTLEKKYGHEYTMDRRYAGTYNKIYC